MAHEHEHSPDHRAFDRGPGLHSGTRQEPRLCQRDDAQSHPRRATEEELQNRRLWASGWEGGHDRRAHSFAYERDVGLPTDDFYSADTRNRDGHRSRDDRREHRRPSLGARCGDDDEAHVSAPPGCLPTGPAGTG